MTEPILFTESSTSDRTPMRGETMTDSELSYREQSAPSAPHPADRGCSDEKLWQRIVEHAAQLRYWAIGLEQLVGEVDRRNARRGDD